VCRPARRACSVARSPAPLLQVTRRARRLSRGGRRVAASNAASAAGHGRRRGRRDQRVGRAVTLRSAPHGARLILAARRLPALAEVGAIHALGVRSALFTPSGVRSACSAQPADSRAAPSSWNRSSRDRCSGMSPRRVSSWRPFRRALHANRAVTRSGGNGVSLRGSRRCRNVQGDAAQAENDDLRQRCLHGLPAVQVSPVQLPVNRWRSANRARDRMGLRRLGCSDRALRRRRGRAAGHRRCAPRVGARSPGSPCLTSSGTSTRCAFGSCSGRSDRPGSSCR